jgi:hypothetical protein
MKVQRFSKGHPLYSEATDSVGIQPIFGQMVDESETRVCYTMERKDTLIPEGTYDFDFYFSPANKLKVPLLKNVPGFEYIEIHPANWPSQLKGCTAVGIGIFPDQAMLSQSVAAFTKLMNLLAGNPGKITYETLNQNPIT